MHRVPQIARAVALPSLLCCLAALPSPLSAQGAPPSPSAPMPHVAAPAPAAAATPAPATSAPALDPKVAERLRWARENRDELFFWTRYEDLLANPQEFPKPPSFYNPSVVVEGEQAAVVKGECPAIRSDR